MSDLAGALSAAAAIGPYFAVGLDASDPAWVELSRLVDDPSVLRERVSAAQHLLAQRCGLPAEQIELRATASIHFLGLAARLVAPALAAAVLTRSVPELSPATVYWQPILGGPIPMAVGAVRLRSADTDDALATLLHDRVIETCVRPLANAVGREFRVSSKLLWGNVASALGGAAAMLGAARPELAARVTDLADRLLDKGFLVGAGRFVRPDASESYFVRDNCCLFYRIPGGGLCGDCVLVRRR